MFVVSFKATRKQLLTFGAGAAALVALIVAIAVWPRAEQNTGTGMNGIKPAAVTGIQRQSYLSGLGYTLEPGYEDVREVLIPDEFDAVFAEYNELQKMAGMDLEPYHGKRVKCWTYRVQDHPDADNGAEVLAHLYVYKDAVIAGDVSSTAQGGFTTGLVKLPPSNEPEPTSATTAIATDTTADNT